MNIINLKNFIRNKYSKIFYGATRIRAQDCQHAIRALYQTLHSGKLKNAVENMNTNYVLLRENFQKCNFSLSFFPQIPPLKATLRLLLF